jgi:hypothetical protein
MRSILGRLDRCMKLRSNASRGRWHRWLALGTGVAGLLLSLVSILNYVRWPVSDMGGIVARALILVVLALQLVPLGGLGVAVLYRGTGTRAWHVAYWMWFVLALVALLVGALGAVAFFR